MKSKKKTVTSKVDVKKFSTTKPKLLSGGNPQIPIGYGDKPVQDYIKAMPGWKRKIGQRLDNLVVEAVPKAEKAVKWNSPFYGLKDQGWFLSFHCFTKYIKLTFFKGTLLKPPPPEESKHKEVRYLNIYEDEAVDETQLKEWIKQASKLPGEKL